MLGVRFRIFSRLGRELAEIRSAIDSVDWLLNEAGQIPLFVPYTDPECTPDNLKFANRVLVQFGSGLPDWGGVLDLPRRRSSTGVSITAYHAEHILSWRLTPKNLELKGYTPGAIYQTLIEAANAEADTGIEIGTISTAGDLKSFDYHHDRVLAQMKTLARKSDEEFAILPVLSGGQIRFQAHWYVRRGSDVTTKVLLDDNNTGDPVFDEAGRIHNRIYIAGSGATWGTERPVGQATDETSRSEHDFREFADVDPAASGAQELEDTAAAALAQVKDPATRLTLVAQDREPGLFRQYHIGDRVHVRVGWKGGDNWAVDGSYRLRSRMWRSDNTCLLVLEER